MQNDTFKTKLAKLVYKIKKAIRLYTTVGRGKGSNDKPYAEIQINEWRDINERLLNELQEIIKDNHLRKVSISLDGLRKSYESEALRIDQDIRSKHSELNIFARNGDFVATAKTSSVLIPLKARHQACLAVVEELNILLSDLVITNVTDNRSFEATDERLKVTSAKILPFKRGAA
jgi:hypothetical protein